ncbi:MAG TPA: formylglycine-generating enzyme family protein, partial [Planctomycetota bacterium]|nr:formylglycine-generating enzyme family protein [Planctomycetota bacterium]
ADKLLEESKAAYQNAAATNSAEAFVDAGFKLEEARIKYLVLQEIGTAETQKTAADRLRAVNQLGKLIHDGRVAITGTPTVAPPEKPAEPDPAAPKKDPPPPNPPVPSAKPSADVTRRLPIPEPAVQRETEKIIRDLFKEPYSKKAPADRKALVRVLLDQAAKSQDDPVVIWVLCKEAQDQAIQLCDTSGALESIDAAARVFDVDAMSMRQAALMAAGKSAKSPEELVPLTEALLKLIDELIREDQYDPADKVAAAAVLHARNSRDADLLAQVTIRAKEVAEAKALFQTMKSVMQTQAKTPDDPGANLEIGRFLCFVKGSWDLGLRFIVKGSDAALKALAEKELAFPPQLADRVALADSWYGLAEKEKSPLRKSQLLAHAKLIYENALTEATALLRVRIEKRLSEIDSAGSARERLTLDLGGGVRMEFVYIKRGTFMMGGKDAPGPEYQLDERPEHRVTISKGYFLGKTEVTQAQWEAVMGSNPSKWKGPDLPVEQVSWDDCQNFLKKLTEKTRGQLKGRVAMMPTEAQWEYACRAGTRTRWTFGDNEKGIGEYAWTKENSGGQTHPVAQKKPNPWGLYDMCGNLWEWCQDWGAPYPAGDAVDPTGAATGDRRILRGGSFDYVSAPTRSGYRSRYNPAPRDANDGLRVCVQ